MSKKLFAVQTTSRAFVTPPDSAFLTDSTHETLSAAEKAVARDKAEMGKSCGMNAWNHNTRIIALSDVSMVSHCAQCDDVAGRWVWSAGMERPVAPHLCERCQREEADLMSEEY